MKPLIVFLPVMILRSLLHHKCKSALKKSWIKNVVILSIECFLLFVGNNFIDFDDGV